jgi:hypothetical protein
MTTSSMWTGQIERLCAPNIAGFPLWDATPETRRECNLGLAPESEQEGGSLGCSGAMRSADKQGAMYV